MSKDKNKSFVASIKVDDKTAKAILDKQTYYPNDAKNLELYNDYIAQQKEPFKAIMHYFNNFINELKDKGKISEYMEFRARIKAPQSALNNDLEKALDDVFGMEFIEATDEEVDFVLSAITKKTNVTRKKDHNKPNGYKAKHRVFAINNETAQEIAEKYNVDPKYLPLIEAQFKTIEVSIKANTGSAAHINYKGLDPKEIQKKYDRGEFKIGYNVPLMWASKNREMVQLSSDETLKKLYPFLDISKKNEITK